MAHPDYRNHVATEASRCIGVHDCSIFKNKQSTVIVLIQVAKLLQKAKSNQGYQINMNTDASSNILIKLMFPLSYLSDGVSIAAVQIIFSYVENESFVYHGPKSK